MKKFAFPSDPNENLLIGKIIEVDGSKIIAELDSSLSELSRVFEGDTYSVGQFGSILKIHFGKKLIYALVGRLRMKSEYQAEQGIAVSSAADERIIEAELFGEGDWKKVDGSWILKFQRGISTYPLPQQNMYLTPKSELKSIYGSERESVIYLGTHVGSANTPCLADMNELLGKHTAVLGSTGAGKSGTVAAIIHSILERGENACYEKWNPRIIILDPHGEYGSAFKKHSLLSTDEGTLKLPYWLLSNQETINLFLGKTEFSATSQTNIIKNALSKMRKEGCDLLGLDSERVNVDSPVPYPLGNPDGLDNLGKVNDELYEEGLIGAINQQRPKNKSQKDHEPFNKIISKISSLINDERMSFIMQEWNKETDEFSTILSNLLGDDSQPRLIDLSGVPNEVAGISSAVIARTLFSLKVWQKPVKREQDPVMLVCEEAHRYVPNRGEAQYEAAQDAIRRIAKEGRKYGIGLLLVSQRPSEVEATVLSQCNSWVVLRITNENDRNHVKSILPDSMSGLSKMLSGLKRQEAIFVGQAATLPSRIMIRTLLPEQLPKSNDIDYDKGWQNDYTSDDELKNVIERWRYQKR